MNRQNNMKRAFTIVELSLAMGFVSALLLAVAMLTIYISGVYNKGITLKQVNQASLAIADDLRRTIGTTSPFDITRADGSESGNYRQLGPDGSDGGRLCTGNYTYVWRIAGSTDDTNKYSTTGETEPSFVKVRDPEGGLCDYTSGTLSQIPRDASNELLNSADRSLAVYEFNVTQGTDSLGFTNEGLYFINFTIGTDTDDLVNLATNECKPPAEVDAKADEYCAVNRFSIVVRAGSAKGGGQ